MIKKDIQQHQQQQQQQQPKLSLQNGYDFILSHVSGALHTRLFNTILKLGICDILEDGKPRTPKELAEIVKAPSEGIHKLLRYFTNYKIFIENQSDGTFEKTQYSSFLTKDSKVFGAANMFSSDMYHDLFRSVPITFSSNQSGIISSMGIKDTWDVLGSEENKILFKDAMQSQTEAFIDDIIKNVNFSNHKIIADIGGSHGKLIKRIIENNPSIEKGINFDLDIVIKSNSNFENPKLSHVSGSFFESVPEADAYILKQIIHDWSDEDSQKIINTISKSMLPGGKLYIFDYVIDEDNYDPLVLYFDCKMYHFFHGAKERSQNEFKQLLNSCGFKIEKFFKKGLVASKK